MILATSALSLKVHSTIKLNNIFALDVRNNFFPERTVMHQHDLPSEVVVSPSLEVFRNHGVAALGDMVSGHGEVGLGLRDLISLFQP